MSVTGGMIANVATAPFVRAHEALGAGYELDHSPSPGQPPARIGSGVGHFASGTGPYG